MRILELAIRSQFKLPEDAIQRIISAYEFKRFKKQHNIFSPNAICDHLFWMTKGLVRCFYIYDGKEVNLRLVSDINHVVAASSYLEEKPSTEWVQTIEACEGYMISKKNVDALCEEYTDVAALRLKTIEQHYTVMEQRLLMIQHKTTEDRYNYYLDTTNPDIVSRIPAMHVASYLGMTPESLSRTKKNLTNVKTVNSDKKAFA